MIRVSDLGFLAQEFGNASSIYILLGSNPNYDAVASALALYLSFKNAGKSAYIASPVDMRVEFSYLVGVDEIKKELGNRNLVVSFPYRENAVEKVSYHMSEDGRNFNLVIAPKKGVKPLDPSTLSYDYEGAEADIVFTVGANSFEDLGFLYQSEPQLFNDALTISLTTFEPAPFAKLSLNTTGQSCLSEGVVALLAALGLEPKDDAATNLLSALEQVTNRFQSTGMTAESFELIARLMRNGARRSAQNPALNPTTQSSSTPAFAQVLKARAQGQPVPQFGGQPVQGNPMAAAMQQNQQSFQQPQFQQQPAQQVPLPVQQPSLFPHAAPGSIPQPVMQQSAMQPQSMGGNPTNPSAGQFNLRQMDEDQKIHQLEHGIQNFAGQGGLVAGQNGIQDAQIVQSGQGIARPGVPLAQSTTATQAPPQEWLKPKVFTGNSRIN